ncbi:nuclear transport factor 2 family protein [Parasphingopyxis marina]|uniref:Nuclear transport factor 2 family protein n=1 Tax=Parasphingopyxis marina TaxID=2761622 RepID=A0A842HUM5_9SPHN|nr:nuclear transport factor 2 family protein [Parasphingopyxis marina]MBC2776635.1 nuclear transport factor 2 family protein [Parasphingopyxis marina]
MDIEEISDRLEIRQVLLRYCRGVDRGIASLIVGAYHEDAIDTHGAFTGSAEEFAALCIENFDKPNLSAQHHLTNSIIELNGDRAAVETYFLAWRPQLGEKTGDPELVQIGGRYLDRFEKRNGSWKISQRNVVFDWVQAPVPISELDETHGYPKGARREADLSAALLLDET